MSIGRDTGSALDLCVNGRPRKGYLKAFKHAQSLSLQFPKRRFVRSHRLRVEGAVMGDFISSTLAPTSLTVKNLLRDGQEYFQLPGFQRFIHRLEYLSINISDWNWSLQSPGIMVKAWMKPAQANLLSLVFTSAAWAPEFPTHL